MGTQALHEFTLNGNRKISEKDDEILRRLFRF